MSLMERMDEFASNLENPPEGFLEDLNNEFVEWLKKNKEEKSYKLWTPSGVKAAPATEYPERLKEANLEQVVHFLTFEDWYFPLIFWIDLKKNVEAIQEEDGTILILFKYNDFSIKLGEVNKNWGKHKIESFLNHFKENIPHRVQREIMKIIFSNQKEFLEETLGLSNLQETFFGEFKGDLNWSDELKVKIVECFENEDYFVSRVTINFNPTLSTFNAPLLNNFLIKEKSFTFHRHKYSSYTEYKKDLSEKVRNAVHDFSRLLNMIGYLY